MFLNVLRSRVVYIKNLVNIFNLLSVISFMFMFVNLLCSNSYVLSFFLSFFIFFIIAEFCFVFLKFGFHGYLSCISPIFSSAGMDAQVSYAFHSERKKNPEKFKNQLTNQVNVRLPAVLLHDQI